MPLTDDACLIIRDLSVAIAPTAGNGRTKTCWAVAHLVATASKQRVRATPSAVTLPQLAAIRRLVADAIGLRS